jgi:predicted DNA-binding transcriptional regulator AlpA
MIAAITRAKKFASPRAAASYARMKFMPPTDDDDERFLSRKQICALTGLCYPTVWDLMRREDCAFPPARRISKTRVGWLRSEVLAWMRSRPVQNYKPRDALVVAPKGTRRVRDPPDPN